MSDHRMMNTDEILAVKFPYSRHLLREFEKRCKTVATCNDGWGILKFPFQGLLKGRLHIKIAETTLTSPVEIDEMA